MLENCNVDPSAFLEYLLIIPMCVQVVQLLRTVIMESEPDCLEHCNTRVHGISQVPGFETESHASVETFCLSINGQIELVSDFGHFH